MYSRAEIDQARKDVASGAPRQLTLDSVPRDAEYAGKGPIYVWNGEKWVDWDLWLASTPVRVDDAPEVGGEETAPARAASAPPKRKQVKRAELPLFDDLDDQTA